MIENIVDFAERLIPIALIGAGGIGKTSVALTVLHNDRVRKRFGVNRRFIRCDQLLASRTHFLCRFSKVIGAGIENPEDFAPLRSFLSSKEMFIILDNAESILDPQGTEAQEIYAVVEELSQCRNVCLCITSRIATTPSDCKRLDVPTLSMDAARNTFYHVYNSGEQSDPVDNILKQLDFHPLSITLLATAAHHNKWDTDRLIKEWESRRTDVLRTRHDKSLTATIELSLASPMFHDLGRNARDLLGVVAFFPQGIDESNLDWLFPTIRDRKEIFDKFCVLSLTYRSNGFVTMLAPLRDHLRPKDPNSSLLLCTIKGYYFRRLSVNVDPGEPGFEEAQWIMSEDTNVEHLLDAFISANTKSTDVWDACAYFMAHLYWHKRRLVVMGPKIVGLPDDHPSKPQCLFELSRLFRSIGNITVFKSLLTHTLKLWRGRGNDLRVAETLRFLADANRQLGLDKEGVQRAREALEIYEQFDDVVGQAQSLVLLAWSLFDDNQLDAAEVAASQAINLIPDQGERFLACQCSRVLGEICNSKGDTETAIDHFTRALGVASSCNWHTEQFWILCTMARLFSDEERFDDAHAHIERAKSYAVNGPYLLGRAMQLQANILYQQCRFEEAKLEVLGAVDILEKLGAAHALEGCRELLRYIDEETKNPVASGESDDDSELLETALLPVVINPHSQPWVLGDSTDAPLIGFSGDIPPLPSDTHRFCFLNLLR